MEKKLKDYLHYYIGAKVQEESGTSTLVGVVGDDAHFISDEHNQYGFCGITSPLFGKLMLRTLSSVSGEELLELVYLGFGASSRDIVEQKIKSIERHPKQPKDVVRFGTSIPYSGYDENGKHYVNATFSPNSINPEQFTYLLSKHFDLFGLIESGLAIDSGNAQSTKTQQSSK